MQVWLSILDQLVIWAFRRLLTERRINDGDFSTSLLIGALIVIPLILGVVRLERW